jgi:hypothetical protein
VSAGLYNNWRLPESRPLERSSGVWKNFSLRRGDSVSFASRRDQRVHSDSFRHAVCLYSTTERPENYGTPRGRAARLRLSSPTGARRSPTDRYPLFGSEAGYWHRGGAPSNVESCEAEKMPLETIITTEDPVGSGIEALRGQPLLCSVLIIGRNKV